MKKQPRIAIIIEIVVLILIVAAVIWYFSANTDNGAPNSQPESQTNENINGGSNANILLNGNSEQVPDKDGDSLSDSEEAELGTNPSLADSDNDGLTDYDEVKVYQSDPLNPDTDGDGNNDGTEVSNGYSPTDDSQLLDFEREKQKFNE